MTWVHAQPEIIGGEYGFQTVDKDFSPGDLVGKELHLILDFKFQTVDTDFSPGDFYRN